MLSEEGWMEFLLAGIVGAGCLGILFDQNSRHARYKEALQRQKFSLDRVYVLDQVSLQVVGSFFGKSSGITYNGQTFNKTIQDCASAVTAVNPAIFNLTLESGTESTTIVPIYNPTTKTTHYQPMSVVNWNEIFSDQFEAQVIQTPNYNLELNRLLHQTDYSYIKPLRRATIQYWPRDEPIYVLLEDRKIVFAGSLTDRNQRIRRLLRLSYVGSGIVVAGMIASLAAINHFGLPPLDTFFQNSSFEKPTIEADANDELPADDTLGFKPWSPPEDENGTVKN